MLTKMIPPTNKKELQFFLGIMNYLGKIFPAALEVCEPLRKLTSSKSEWMWNNTYQQLFDKAKAIIIKDATTKFFNEKERL